MSRDSVMADSIRPVVHALIAKDLGDGRVGRTRRVSLATAYLAMKAGWLVLGPDPEDLETLALWERINCQPPFNPPRTP